MQTKYKRHEKVILLVNPDPEYIEYSPELEEEPQIKKGMMAEINIILPNGRYHVRILDKKGNTIAYVPMAEEDLGPAK
jgi:hypothetical protein